MTAVREGELLWPLRRLRCQPVAERLRAPMRRDHSPHHVPHRIYMLDSSPYTLTGKKIEVPVRRILMGVLPAKAAKRAAMANIDALNFHVEYARTHARTQRDYAPS